jgi:hypothetical protein
MLGSEDAAGDQGNAQNSVVIPGYKPAHSGFGNTIDAHVHPDSLAIWRDFAEKRLLGTEPLVRFIVEIGIDTSLTCLARNSNAAAWAAI